MPSPPRDSQAKKVYDAERPLAAGTFIDNVQRMEFVRKITRSRFFGSRWAGVDDIRAQMKVVKTRRCDIWIENRTLQVSETVVTDPIRAAHAIAHLLAPPTIDHAWHGPLFCRTYLEVVKRFVGEDTEVALRAAFKEKKVKTRTVSPEAREAMRERYKDRQVEGGEESLKRLRERLERHENA